VKYVDEEIIGDKAYIVTYAKLRDSPVLYCKWIRVGWAVDVEKDAAVLDGGAQFLFTWNGRFLNLSDPNSL
jgi:hypothetical protein